jgi:hypothetical protein
MRGLAEKIWKVFAPSACAFRAAFSRERERDVWMPMRRIEMITADAGLERY